jgi:uncharacterized protein (TIGR02453 family)
MFTQATFSFLDELSKHNNRLWFEDNKSQYDTVIRQPAFKFITAMEPHLAKIAPNFRAEAKNVDGSLMRVYRDTRFSRNKSPYKTNIGIQFRHSLGKDVHAPGWYLHIATDECFLGVGCWHPEADALAQIRARISEFPEEWLSAKSQHKFALNFTLEGDTLSRPPKGYPATHPAIEDLKRKDFIGLSVLTKEQVCSNNLVKIAHARFSEAVPLMQFLCNAMNVHL